MKKNFLLLFLFLIIISTSGCQNNINSSSQLNNNKDLNNSNTAKKVNSDLLENKSNFNSKDLIYFIMTDRFYDGDSTNNNFSDVDKNDTKAYHGGDLKGIIEKLDYIKSLGTTAIWITPVVKNEEGGYHGYWANDFYKVDPHLGNMDNLKNLVEEAHKKDIKVMLDHVVNHTGYKSPWLKDKNKKDWFHDKVNITNWSDQDQIENGWLAGLPDLNQENNEVKKYLIDNTLWWIENTGVDGMRLDTVRHVPKEFWSQFANTIKEKYPDFYLLGEVWNENSRYLEQYHKLGIDGMTNYSLYKGIREAFTRFGKTNSLISALKSESNFSNPTVNGIFIDNHDNPRLISQAGEFGDEYLKQALTFIMTYPSIPIIYYGTEIGMEGKADPDNRKDMNWNEIENNDILQFYKELVNLRETHPALNSEEFKLLDYNSYFISYMRKTEDDSIIVILNVQNKERDAVINIPTNSLNYEDLLTDTTYKVENKELNLKLKPLDILILQSK